MAALRNKTAEKQKLCAHLSAGLSNNLHNYLLPDGLAALLVCSQLVAGWTLWASGHSRGGSISLSLIVSEGWPSAQAEV